MHIKCPNCETIFDLPQRIELVKKYKCSVCNHVWSENIKKTQKKTNLTSVYKSNLKKVFFLNIIIFVLVILASIIYRDNLENVDNNWKSFYLFFDMLIPVQ